MFCGRSELRSVGTPVSRRGVAIGGRQSGILVELVDWIVSRGKVHVLTLSYELQWREAGVGCSGKVVLLVTLGAAGGVTQLAWSAFRPAGT